LLTALGPEEATLGENARIVYLHGAWVLSAEAALALAAAVGLLGILSRRQRLQRWSTALGRTGIFFWVAYLPLSLWAMQANWNGLFLNEPRFRVAVVFAITGVLAQAGTSLLGKPAVTSLVNFAFGIALWLSISRADYILHPPPSPIFGSGILSLQLYFVTLIFLTLAAAYFMTRWWLSR
jgi:hypothetical protein